MAVLLRHPEPLILICAGEVSSDKYASLLVKSLKKKAPSIRIVGIGGEYMREEGVYLLDNIVNKAVIGLTEVIPKLPFFFKVYRRIVEFAKRSTPSVCIFVDFPGFNLILAKKMKKLGIKTVYYIPPKIWAWGSKRIKKIKRYIDFVFTIFEFEEEFYKSHGYYSVKFVGHPVIELIPRSIKKTQRCFCEKKSSSILKIGILPGSRVKEISSLLPLFLKAANIIKKEIPSKWWLSTLPMISSEVYEKYLNIFNGELYVPNFSSFHQELLDSDFIISASGTVNIEMAYLNIPGIVCYKTSPITYWIAKSLLNINYISPVNIIAKREIYPEFIQYLNPQNIASTVIDFLRNPLKLDKIKDSLFFIRKKIDKFSRPSEIVAEEILRILGI